jgi:hypothetical protein
VDHPANFYLFGALGKNGWAKFLHESLPPPKGPGKVSVPLLVTPQHLLRPASAWSSGLNPVLRSVAP